MSFHQHVENLCHSASMKTKALIRIGRFLVKQKANILCNVYILSAFNYCPITWMFCSKKSNLLMETVLKRSQRVVENDFSLSLIDILNRTNRSNCHRKNLEILLLEIYKSINSLNPIFMSDIFVNKNSIYSLRSGKNIEIPKIKTTIGAKSFVFGGGALAWNHLPERVKEITFFKCL